MSEAAVRHNGGLSQAIYFRFGHLMLVSAHGYGFEIAKWSKRPFLGVQHEEKETQTFSSAF